MNSLRPSATKRPPVRFALAGVLALVMLGALPEPAVAGCEVITQAAKRGAEAEKTKLSRQEAATKEAIDNLKACLERINTALNRMIPGVPSITPADFSAILNNLMNRACQVVTTKIDQAGNVVQGTVSGAANRYIGDINKAIDPNGVLGAPVINTNGTQSLPSAYPGVTGSPGSVATPGIMPGYVQGGQPQGSLQQPGGTQPGMWDKLSCYFSPNCK